MKNERLTIEQERIKLQIESGFGFYGGKYKNAKTDKEREDIIEQAINN